MNSLINLLNKYINALKKINKKHYFTPMPILFALFFLWQRYNSSTRGLMNIFLYPIYSWYLILAIMTYPFSRMWVESTNIVRLIFKNSSVFKQGKYALSKQKAIQSEIRVDYVVKSARVRGSNKRFDYVSTTDWGTRDRASTKTAINIVLFVFKDIVFRYFIYAGTMIIIPILFLFAVPDLSKKGVIEADTEVDEMRLEDT